MFVQIEIKIYMYLGNNSPWSKLNLKYLTLRWLNVFRNRWIKAKIYGTAPAYISRLFFLILKCFKFFNANDCFRFDNMVL